MHVEPIGKYSQPIHLLNKSPARGADHALPAIVYAQADGCAEKDDAVRSARNELQRLSAQLLTIQERERQRIAADLHDGIGQSLVLIKMGLEDAAGLLTNKAFDEVAISLQQLMRQVQETSAELRRVAMNLRPAMLDDLGILATLSWFFREFDNAQHGIKIEKQLLMQESDIPPALKVTIFRILQEAVCNIVKHAHASLIRVSLTRVDGVLHFTIEDNGQGFGLAEQGNYCALAQGHGLVSMQERASYSGGICQIESVVGQGTRISASWPCE